MPNFQTTGTFWIASLVTGLFKPKKTVDDVLSKDPKRDTTIPKPAERQVTKNYAEESTYVQTLQNADHENLQNNPKGTHKIAKGETLYKIASQYGVSISDLLKANPDLKTDKKGNKIIQEGALLKLPENAVIPEKPQAKSSMEKTFGKWQIEERKGSFSVMSKFNLYKEELQKLNPDIDLDNIKAGQNFKVPGYKVEAGDSFAKIAKAHDITEKMLKELNPGIKTLKTGSVINVPKKAGEDLGLGELEIEVEEFVAEEAKTHTIKEGETLYRIAKDNKIPVWALMLTNDIKDPKKLEKGQVLEIPSPEELKDLEQTKLKTENQKNETTTHKVGKDEVLSVIAKKFGVPAWAIAAKNNLQNPNKLSIGQTLKIPDKNEISQLRQANIINKTTAKVKTKTVKRKTASKVSAKNNTGSISPNMGLITHKVRPKDTITSIAKEYGVDVQDLLAYNDLKGKSRVLPLAKQKITSIKISGNQKSVKALTGVSQDFLNDLISLEKKKRTLYDDGCGYKTIGIGHNTKAHRDGHKYRNRELSDTEIYSLLTRDILEAQAITKKHLGEKIDKLSQKQKEAVYSLIFNTGGLASSPNLVKAIKSGKFAAAAQEFDQIYGTVDGKKEVMPGLAKRRFVEIATFVEGSKFNSKEMKQVMAKTQEIYDLGYKSIQNKNSRVDYNAYAKKFLGDFIDKGYIKIRT